MTDFDRFAIAAAERQFHANHVCNDSCPKAFCPIHGVVGDHCDENCLEALRAREGR